MQLPDPASRLPAYAAVNEGLETLCAELTMLQQGGSKDYFRMSIVRFGSRARVIEEAAKPADVDPRIKSIVTFDGSSGTTNMAEALDEAGRILRRNPGRDTDFQPWVFVFTDGVPDNAPAALDAAARLRQVGIPAGVPKVYAFGFGDADDAFLTQLADPECYRRVTAKDVSRLLPAIGTVAGTGVAASALQSAIQQI